MEEKKFKRTESKLSGVLSKMKQTEMKSTSVGRWHITKMREWDKAYCNMEVRAYIQIGKNGIGEFQFGLVQGSTSGEFKKETGYILYDFTCDGSDENDSANGDGWMKILQDGTAQGEIRFHMSGKSAFWAKRAKTK